MENNEQQVINETTENLEETAEKEQALENEELVKAQNEANEYKDRWMRSVAEFDNYKKRNANIWKEAYSEGLSDAIVKILPVGDHLDMAVTLGLDKKTEEGVLLIRKKFDDILKSLEIEEINPVGEKFNPEVAEAIMQVEGEENEESETVKQVFQKGYKYKEKIVRYAKVSVIK